MAYDFSITYFTCPIYNSLRCINNAFQVAYATYTCLHTIAYVISITHFKWLMQQHKWFEFFYNTSTCDLKWKIKPKWPHSKLTKNMLTVVCCLPISRHRTERTVLHCGTVLYKGRTRSYYHKLIIIHSIPIILWNIWIKVNRKIIRYSTVLSI
jgi:hypothetical protein